MLPCSLRRIPKKIMFNLNLLKKKLPIINKLAVILTKKDRKRLLLLSFFSLIISAVETIGITAVMPFVSIAADFSLIETNPYYNYVFRLFNFQNQNNFVMMFGVILVFFYIFRSFINLFYIYLLNKFSQDKSHSIAFMLFKKYTEMPYKNFIQQNSSNLMKSITQESSNVTALIQTALTMLSEVGVLIFIYSMLLFVNYEITLFLTLLLALNAITLTKTVSKKMKVLGVLRADIQKQLFEVINKSFANMKIIKLRANNNIEYKEFEDPSYGLVGINTKAATITQIPRYFLEAIGFVIVVGVINYLLWQEGGDISSSIGLLTIFVLALYRLLPSINRIMSGYNTITYHYKALDIVCEELNYDSELFGNSVVAFNRKIELDHIHFKYQNGGVVLNDIKLTIKKGERVAFVGESGSGKSTLIDIIMGLHMPTKGHIFIDDQALEERNLLNWRKKIGYVSQGIYLFDGTVADNVVFGGTYNKKKIVEILKKVHMYDFLQTKDGINTKVGESGVLISGGQKQRIAIARAIYNDPEILILDEATSALDNLTEMRIMEEVYKISKDMTLIVIAHRLSSIDKCSKVYTIKRGMIK
jgi:ATP-binding cassette, subfamily B, bacterial PglK